MHGDLIDTKLAELRRQVRAELRPPVRRVQRGHAAVPRASRVSRADWLSATLALLKVGAVIALPFYVYVRSSVALYAGGVSPWLAVMLGATLTMGIVAGYATWISRRLSGKVRAAKMARWIALPFAAAWCAYAVLYLARVNAKNDQVRGYYGAVHPVLRAAMGTAILVDPDIVVTDMRRVPEDYARMGLPVNDRTLHYRQKNGWVHAVDLRTRGRGAVKNAAMQLYFRSMGFRTLRHVGTADHLHVGLPVRD
jgi:hypothetical protein